MIVAIAMLVNAGLIVVDECQGDLIGATPPWRFEFESVINFVAAAD